MTSDPGRAANESDDEAEPAGRARWLNVLLAAGALLAAALLGATGGLLLAGPSEDSAAPSPVDVGFAQDMSLHHRQAVTMAGWVRDHSTDPAIRQLAFDIEMGQNAQLGRMQGWLALWSRSAMPVGEPMEWMNGQDHGIHADGDARPMPGMATTEELERLRSLTGRELDVYFLQLMIRHHQGGTPMLRAAVDRATIGQVRNLAGQMLTAQTAEVDAMRAMLVERGGQPLPAPK